MVTFSASLKTVGGARSGIAPVHLLDVQDVNGNTYYWSDRKITAPAVASFSGLVDGSVDVPATAMPWNPNLVANAAYPFGHDDGTAAIVVSGLQPGQLLAITATGQVGDGTGGLTIGPDGGAQTGATTGPAGDYFPTKYMTGTMVGALGLCGAFTDAAGAVIEVVSIGSAATLTVPVGASQLQLGTNDDDYGPFNGATENIGSFQVSMGTTTKIYSPWLLDVPEFAFHRSLQTDTGSFVLQNLSGDTLSRDAEKILRGSALEGALFVYRLWQPDAEAAWLEVHGTLTVDPADTSQLTLKGLQLMNPSQDDTPLENFCESCQIDWGGNRCGSKQPNECSYSFQTCQVVERIMVVLNNYEKNFGEATASTARKVINRRRRI